MKGFVFSLKHDDRIFSKRYVNKSHTFSFKRFISKYGIHTAFLVLFLFGIVFGASATKGIPAENLKQLDFLFVTDIKGRLELSSFGIFCSSLSANFLFVLCSFLLSFSAWGAVALPLLCAFKGYGIGVSSTYLFYHYSITGIGFYILVILPGVALFVFTFIISLKESLFGSLGLLRVYLHSKTESISRKNINAYLYKNFIILIFTCACAVLDMLLWMLFANMFNF